MSLKISVIVPIYNSEKYLEDCLQSIVNQTYTNLEIILINDGSSDSSHTICSDFEVKDDRIIVLKQENKGQAAARNLGLKVASGDFIAFIDSDDSISLDLFLENVNILNANNEIDFLQFPIYRNYGVDEAFIDKGKVFLYSKADDFKILMLEKSIISWIVCDKIFKKEFLKNRHFQEDMIYEDNYFMINLIDGLNYIYISDKGLYYYHTRPNSTTTSVHSPTKDSDTLRVLCRILDNLDLKQYQNMYLKYLVRIINVEKSLAYNFNQASDLKLIYLNNLNLFSVLSSNLNLKDKIKLVLAKLG